MPVAQYCSSFCDKRTRCPWFDSVLGSRTLHCIGAYNHWDLFYGSEVPCSRIPSLCVVWLSNHLLCAGQVSIQTLIITAVNEVDVQSDDSFE